LHLYRRRFDATRTVIKPSTTGSDEPRRFAGTRQPQPPESDAPPELLPPVAPAAPALPALPPLPALALLPPAPPAPDTPPAPPVPLATHFEPVHS